MNTAGADAFHDAARQYESAAGKVDVAAASAAREHIVAPAVARGAYEGTDIFRYRGNLHVGVHPDDPGHEEFANREYGTEERPAGDHVRHARRHNGDDALAAFYREMMR